MVAVSLPGSGVEPQTSVFTIGGVSGLESKCRIRTCDSTIHSRMLFPPELISWLLFERGHSVHALRSASFGAPAGNSENPDR